MPKRQLALRVLAPALLLAVAYGVWWLLGPLVDADPSEIHLTRTYAIGGVAEFLVVLLVSVAITRIENPGPRRLLSHLRHCVLLYLVAAFAVYPLATNDAGHLSHILGFMFALAMGQSPAMHSRSLLKELIAQRLRPNMRLKLSGAHK